MAKKIVVGVVGSVLLGVVLYGTSFFGMLRTATDQIQKAADDAIPVGFKVADAERMVNELDPEIKKYMRQIAVQQVDVASLEEKIKTHVAAQEKNKRQILALNGELKRNEKEYVFDGTTYTHEQVSNDILNKTTAYKASQETLEREQGLLKARKEALAANSTRLEEMITMKKDLETELALVKTRVETQKAEEAVGLLEIDNSKMANARKLIDQLNRKLDVDEKVRAAEGRLTKGIVAPEKKEIRNVSQEVEELFGSEAKSKTDL